MIFTLPSFTFPPLFKLLTYFSEVCPHIEPTWTFEHGYSHICKLINKNILCFCKSLFVDGKKHITQAIYQSRKEKYNCFISTCNGKRKLFNGKMSSVAHLCPWGTNWEHADQVQDSYGKQPVDSQLSNFMISGVQYSNSDTTHTEILGGQKEETEVQYLLYICALPSHQD